MPSPPGRFSTTTGWSQRVLSRSPSSRAPMSTPDPGPSGTRNFTVRCGQTCAADGGAASKSGASRPKASNGRCTLRMGFSDLVNATLAHVPGKWNRCENDAHHLHRARGNVLACRGSIPFDLDVGRFDDRPPLLDLGLVECTERGWRLLLARRDHLAEIGQVLPYRRIGQGIHHRAVELDDHFLGRALCHPQAMPERNVHA